MEPAAQVCALSGNGTLNLLVYGMMLQPTEYPARARCISSNMKGNVMSLLGGLRELTCESMRECSSAVCSRDEFSPLGRKTH